jgi:hypothetical protein
LIQKEGDRSLSTDWWRTMLSIPKKINPVAGHPDILDYQRGEVIFLAGTSGLIPKRTVTLPTHRDIYLPIFSSLCSEAEYPGMTHKDLKERATQGMSRVIKSGATISSLSLPEGLVEITPFRIMTESFDVQMPPDNILNDRAGIFVAVADGLWIHLESNETGEFILRLTLEAVSLIEDVYHREDIVSIQDGIGSIFKEGFELSLTKMENGKAYRFNLDNTTFEATKTKNGVLELSQMALRVDVEYDLIVV